MDTQFLINFLTIVNEGTLSKAAEKLYLSQPTLSRQLLDMEATLGIKLFNRGQRQMSLTEAGLIFEKKAKEILALIEQTKDEIKLDSTQLIDTIRIGSVESKASMFLADKMNQFYQDHPHVRFELFTANGDGIREKLDKNDIDCGLLLQPIEVAKYATINLPIKEKWGVILPIHHPLAQKGFIDGNDLLNLPIIGSNRSIIINEIASWLAVDISHINFSAQHNLLTNSLLLAQKGMGYPFTIEGAFSIRPFDGLCFVPLSPLRETSHVFAYKKNMNFNPSILRFIDFINSMDEIGISK